MKRSPRNERLEEAAMFMRDHPRIEPIDDRRDTRTHAGIAPDQVNFTTLSREEVRAALDEVARDAQAAFGTLSARQLNWRPDATGWSIGQCLEHLLTANRLMLRAAAEALDPGQPRTVWQRLPLLPGLLGRMLIRSQSPTAARKFTAPRKAQPAATDVPADIVARFVEQHREVVDWMQALDERDAARAIMTSPFAQVITYSVLDGCRLVAAHDRRHLEQARRVMFSPGFPSASPAA